jgi:hypothetical protein
VPRADFRFAWRPRARYPEIDVHAVGYTRRSVGYSGIAWIEDHLRAPVKTIGALGAQMQARQTPNPDWIVAAFEVQDTRALREGARA